MKKNDEIKIIDRLKEEQDAIIEYLKSSEDESLEKNAKRDSNKFLVLAIASFFEEEVMKITKQFQSKISQDKAIGIPLNKEGTNRKYHTYFRWESANANRYFKLFGEDIEKKIKDKISKDKEESEKNNRGKKEEEKRISIDESIKAFLKIGRLRNELTHQNIANYSLEVSRKEIHDLYQQASKFIDFLKQELIPNSL